MFVDGRGSYGPLAVEGAAHRSDYDGGNLKARPSNPSVDSRGSTRPVRRRQRLCTKAIVGAEVCRGNEVGFMSQGRMQGGVRWGPGFYCFA